MKVDDAEYEITRIAACVAVRSLNCAPFGFALILAEDGCMPKEHKAICYANHWNVSAGTAAYRVSDDA